MSKVLVVVDYQKDFVDGALGFPKAVSLEEGIAAKVEEAIREDRPVVFTLDTHGKDYLDTRASVSLVNFWASSGRYGKVKRWYLAMSR